MARESLEAKIGRIEAAVDRLVPLQERAAGLALTEARSREEERLVLDKALQAAGRIEATAVKAERLEGLVERLEAALKAVAAEQYDKAAALNRELEAARGKLKAIEGAAATAFAVAETLRALAASGPDMAKERQVAAAWAAMLSGLCQELLSGLQGVGKQVIVDRKALEFLALGEATMARVGASLPPAGEAA